MWWLLWFNCLRRALTLDFVVWLFVGGCFDFAYCGLLVWVGVISFGLGLVYLV